MSPLAIILISLLCYAFFSGMEIAVVSSKKMRLFNDSEKPKGAVEKALHLFRKNPLRFIHAILTGCIVSLIIFCIFFAQEIGEHARLLFDNKAFIIAAQVVVSSLAIILIAEFFPNLFFRRYADFFVRLLAIPALFFYFLFYPVVWLFDKLSNLFFKLFRINIKKDYQRSLDLGKGYLDYFIQQGIEDAEENQEVETEVKLFQNALDFSTVKLRNCIVPRIEIVAVETSSTKEELIQLFVESGFSKIIVYEEDLDNIIGYIHSAEMFKDSTNWQQYINQIPVVPETMIAIKLMNTLMQEKKSIAVVVDEFGGTTGIVTLEDLVEEIFGDIEDEHDSQSFLARKISDNEYIFSGRNEIDKLNEEFDLDLPESNDYITLAGMILEYCGNFPELNEEIPFGKFVFTILRISSKKIELVKVRVKEE